MGDEAETVEEVEVIEAEPVAGVTVDEVWAEMAEADNPFSWPEMQRSMHTNGAKCLLWGKSTTEMSIDELIMFVGFLDTIYSEAVLNRTSEPAEVVGGED